MALSTNSQQAAFVAQRVLELHEEGIALHEMAVLYRAHYHSMEVQLEFTRRGIPFVITSGLRFFEQAHIKDVAAFLRFTVNPRDEMAFKRMVKLFPGDWPESPRNPCGIRPMPNSTDGRDFVPSAGACDRRPRRSMPGTSSFAPWRSWRRAGGMAAPSAMIESVAFAIYDDYMKSKFANYEARREDIATLSAFARQFDSAEDFLAQLALLGAVETADTFRGESDSEKITLSTIHQAKGLEWKVVFLIWLTEGMFPSARSCRKPGRA